MSLLGELSFISLLGVVAFGIPKIFPEIPLYSIMNFVILLLYVYSPFTRYHHEFRSRCDAIENCLEPHSGVLSRKFRLIWISASVRNLSLRNLYAALRPRAFLTDYSDEEGIEGFRVGPYIDLEVERGQIYYLYIGGNGSGKTTLAKLITGLYSPDRE